MSENLMPHIRLPKDLDVDCALLPGDPARADAVATHLEDAELLASNLCDCRGGTDPVWCP